MKKLILLDKSVFHGSSNDKLCSYAESNTLIIPWVLTVECLKSDKRDSHGYHNQLDKLIKSGAFIGYSPRKLADLEKKLLQPVNTIIDEEQTRICRDNDISTCQDDIIKEADNYNNSFKKGALGLARLMIEKLYNNSKNYDGKLADNKIQDFIQAVDQSMDICLQKFEPEYHSYVKSNWFIWHMRRMFMIYCLHFTGKTAQSGIPGDDKITSALHDSLYLSYLPWADGLLTRDNEQASNALEAYSSKQILISHDFVRDIVVDDYMSDKWEGRVATRFPPEPNGYLHIGHAKSICLNFGIAAEFGGSCNLRFDDTNPIKEEQEYIDAIIEDVRWLGFDWADRLFYASDYFEQMYQYAEQLVQAGKAYVCDLTAEETREHRGTLTEPGKDSPYRNRSIEENLELFRRICS